MFTHFLVKLSDFYHNKLALIETVGSKSLVPDISRIGSSLVNNVVYLYVSNGF